MASLLLLLAKMLKITNISQTVRDRAISSKILICRVVQECPVQRGKIWIFATFGGHLGFLRKMKRCEYLGKDKKVCPGCIAETVRCRQLILGTSTVIRCRCAMSWSDLDLTFDLAVVTLSLKILSGLYLKTHKV